MELNNALRNKLKRIKWLVTDCDGVLTDSSVYYSNSGDVMKRFSIRDGMGVVRLRKIAKIETAIMTGEKTKALQLRAQKLKITELYQHINEKEQQIVIFAQKQNIDLSEIAFIGDDCNDEEVLKLIGFSACPSDAIKSIKAVCDYICEAKGGHGVLREVAELIIEQQANQ